MFLRLSSLLFSHLPIILYIFIFMYLCILSMYVCIKKAGGDDHVSMVDRKCFLCGENSYHSLGLVFQVNLWKIHLTKHNQAYIS